ncbi:MAG: hypothetical protein QE285_16530 [Aquabacterium sp.]|nr:hypothetical protein [Aquabacterium sp.]
MQATADRHTATTQQSAQKPATKLLYGCLTHVPLWVDVPSYVTPIYLGQAQGPGRQNLRDLAPEWEAHHPVLGSMAGVFALRNLLLQQHPDTTQVGICQYRKFVSRKCLGEAAETYKVMDVVHRDQLHADWLADAMRPDCDSFLLAQPGQFSVGDQVYDYLYQYKEVHHVEDFLRFTAVAVELGVLHKNEVGPFFNEKIWFTGGVELGFFPTAFWLDSVGAVEAVIRACLQMHPATREGAQARAWSFCAERLGSFLLLRHLRANYPLVHWLETFTGRLNLVTEGGHGDYVPGI